ncbi:MULTISPECIES: hypothetical protein [Kitasatospora]|uniref:Uncharacterized protein n=1 Tax=Kitasatospora setae (strain ATCC 33774 / DSM 43861 / JCM 3304 / KCC A-0304 / NBRC 14216 / KM-6054) TaxID=452652 RepID=E4N1X8_KITSK|nr:MULTISPECIES: hypothetical protein [Kitasatospora]BAJ32162.1 hypothetical protein KSE_64030 [Kitasatospora setae KM-6054]
MRPTRTAAAALLGTTVLLGLAGTAPASAKGSEPAWVSPAQAQPGQSVSVSVTCASSTEKTVTATSLAFAGGSTTLRVGPDGKYSGSATVISEQEMAAAAAKRTTNDSSWGVDGKCPNGDGFVGAVAIAVAGASGSAAGAGVWEGARLPHGAVETGLGGSVGVDGTRLALGAALVASGVGGFWLLRRRGAAAGQGA